MDMLISQLDPMQQRFAENYLVSANITQSALDAGYSASSARTTGQRLMQKPAVKAYIEEAKNRAAKKAQTIQDRLIAELASIAFANIEDFTTLQPDGRRTVDYSRATREQLASLNSITTKKRTIYNAKGEKVGEEVQDKFNMNDKLRGIELLGRHHGMFQQAEQRVVVDVADRLLRARSRMLSIADQSGGADDEGGGG